MTQENARSIAPPPLGDGAVMDNTSLATTAPSGSSAPATPPASQAIARVASPVRNEATSVRFYGWAARGRIIEKTQLVWTSSVIGSQTIRFFGVVEEVFRRSRRRNIDEEVDIRDGEIDFDPPFGLEGITFAEVLILRVDPPYLTAPLEESLIFLAGEDEAAEAYGYNEMFDTATNSNWRLPVGLLRSGGASVLGPAYIDLRYLSGDRAGHLNVSGKAGSGTKSSFLLVTVRSLIDFAKEWDNGDPKREPFSVRPIVFNVKGNDLMYIDMENKSLTDEQRELWQKMGIEPRPFTEAEFHSPCRGTNRSLARVQRPGPSDRQTNPYYWTLADVIRFGLWNYLFSDETQQSESMMALAEHLLGLLAEERDPAADFPAGLKLRAPGESGIPQSFTELKTWLRDALRDKNHLVRDGGVYTFGTTRALLSRLNVVLSTEGRTIFDDGTGTGKPLNVIKDGTTDPVVIDIAGLPNELRRFVVAAVLDQVKAHQMGPKRVRGQVYFLVLDELGLYAPRGARDPITKLFEHVAAQLRSQGIILLGAQQQASNVSDVIFGNSEFKALGVTSPVELESPTWNRLLTPPQKARALMLRPEEKMVLTTRGWMNLVVPYPAWAMKESEAQILAPPTNGAVPDVGGPPDEADADASVVAVPFGLNPLAE